MAKKQAFKNVDPQFAAAFNRGDAAGVAALYTRDTLYLVPDAAMAKGRKAMQAAVQRGIDSGWRNMKFTSVQAGSDGDLAYHIGKLAVDVPTATGKRREKGKFIDIYKRQKDGSWMIHATIYNSDKPQE
ncbi:MAG: YybH family protein [Alphaproteobacteria bacterium]